MRIGTTFRVSLIRVNHGEFSRLLFLGGLGVLAFTPLRWRRMHTRTGNFAIGFRRGWGDWQRRDVGELARWATGAGFAHLDLGWATPDDVDAIHAAGLRLGSSDLLDFGNLLSSDPAKRKELLDRNVAYVKQ